MSLRWLFSDIKLAHTVFALPFAVLGAFLASGAVVGDGGAVWGWFSGQLALVVACMFFARTWAMLVNRLADRAYDAANPRTSGRALPSGRLPVRDAVMVALLSAAGFIACCAGFWIVFGNVWPAALSVPALAWIAFYSFTKRFTALSHAFLGGALAASPLAAAIAIDPAFVVESRALWLIALMVLVWVAGFDVIYALQDLEFDRAAGLRSAPAALGWRGAIRASRGLHAIASVALIGAWLSDPRLGWIFGAAVVVAVAALAMEHVVLARRGLAGLPMAFFTLNGVVSVALGAAGSLDAALG